jgi:SAM-dependent methyltransferase
MSKWFEKKGRWYFRCRQCRLIQIPAGVMMTNSGLSIYEVEHNIFMQEGNLSYYLDESNMASARQKLLYVQEYVAKGARLLDAGANYGHFLKVAESVFDASGFDISPQAVAWGQQHFRVRNRTASIYELPSDLGTPFDVVTCWDVIEHLADPLAALHQLYAVTKPGGYLFLSTPDSDSFVARLLGRRWYYLDPVQHVTLFTQDDLRQALDRTGFQVLDVCSFGHHYRVRYIFDRLWHLNQRGIIRWLSGIGRRLPQWIQNRALYIGLGDVIGLVSRRN